MKSLGWIFFCLIITVSSFIYSQEVKNLSTIAVDIEQYLNKEITLTMRLKNVDLTFEKIVFYDSSNIDVEFDISGKERKALLGPYMKNIHEGMFYVVTFRVSGLTPSDLIIGQLKSFVPFFAEKLPE